MKPLVTPFRDLPAATLVNGALQPSFVEAAYAGSFFHCRKATNPFRMAFDAGQFFDWQGGYLLANTPFKKIVFANDTLFPMRIYFSVGTENVAFSGTEDAKVAETFTRGNMGLGYKQTAPSANNTNGDEWNPDGVVAVDLTANDPIFVPGIYQGHRRKQITFNNANADHSLAVFTSDGGLFELIPIKTRLTYETSSDFYLFGSQGNATGVIVNEIYYAN
jgi:hypothetical protein